MQPLLKAVAAMVVALLAIAPLQTRAAKHKETGTVSYNGDIKLPRGVLSGGLRFDVTIELSALLDEPVVNCGAHWAPGPLSKTSISGDFPQGERFVTLDRTQQDKLSFYDLDLALSFLIPGGKSAYILCDAGIVGHGQQKPFNVAGSPNWNRLICVSRYRDLSDCVPDDAGHLRGGGRPSRSRQRSARPGWHGHDRVPALQRHLSII